MSLGLFYGGRCERGLRVAEQISQNAINASKLSTSSSSSMDRAPCSAMRFLVDFSIRAFDMGHIYSIPGKLNGRIRKSACLLPRTQSCESGSAIVSGSTGFVYLLKCFDAPSTSSLVSIIATHTHSHTHSLYLFRSYLVCCLLSLCVASRWLLCIRGMVGLEI